ncbi:bacillithiol biosynthesis deacetylase BshB2 [Paenibacillus yanchengensis]|uniref:Bacillithiol biosynthesis deacetylase BshB2 n=1 Tax=Paenibacillus yanchengensis TaxID=2035833 RepID=A0ABW4YNR3_9BACL
MKEKHILVVLPHPDDEAFGLAGTLAMHIDHGTPVTYACLTLGEMGRNMGVPPFANRVTLPQIRKQELERSCEAIGITDLRMLGFHDKTIEFEEPAVLDKYMDALLEELEPSLVVTFYPGYAVHADHNATGAAVMRAIKKLPEANRPRIYALAFANNSEQEIGKPDVVVDVRPYIEQKVASLMAHRSQFQMPELVGDKPKITNKIIERFGYERFWTYSV